LRRGWLAITGAVIGIGTSLLGGCGRHDSAATDLNVVNFYNWNDYIAPDTIAGFEKLTGIKVNVAYFDTNETLESRILTGHSGFDVVVPTAPFFQRQIKSGAFLPLDKTGLPNLVNLDPAIMARVALNDPGNAHGVVYAWGTYGIGYNEKLVKNALPDVPLTSWRLIFDPTYASKLAGCGIGTLDAPAGVVRLVLRYLGRNPNNASVKDLADAAAVLNEIRPYIRTIDTVNIINAMANGDLCIAIGYNGDFVQARKRAADAKNGVKVDYLIPEEGSLLWFDMLGIPKDAPHAANALKLINYLMTPQVSAAITNYTGFANANTAATRFINPAIATDPAVYPPLEQRERLFVQAEDSPEQIRAITRLWQKFKTGQ
jgi:putrescine transport system substrate-binding protein